MCVFKIERERDKHSKYVTDTPDLNKNIFETKQKKQNRQLLIRYHFDCFQLLNSEFRKQTF